MILFMTPHTGIKEKISSFEADTGEVVHCAQSLSDAMVQLRQNAYAVAVLDQPWLEADPGGEVVVEHLGAAIPLYMNPGIHGYDRVLKDIRLALARRRREETAVRLSVKTELYSELKDTLTSMLLSCSLALECRGVPEMAAEKMRSAHDLTRKMAECLE